MYTKQIREYRNSSLLYGGIPGVILMAVGYDILLFKRYYKMIYCLRDTRCLENWVINSGCSKKIFAFILKQ